MRKTLASKFWQTSWGLLILMRLMRLEQLYQFVSEEQFPQGLLTIALLENWHRRWLGNIYEWAGQERAVNISKGGFMFAPSAQLPKLLHEFGVKYLAQYTPCII